MVLNHLGENEAQKLFRKSRVKVGFLCQTAKPLQLKGFPLGVRGGHAKVCLEPSNLLGRLESLREQMHQGSINIVDAFSKLGQFRRNGGHTATLSTIEQTT